MNKRIKQKTAMLLAVSMSAGLLAGCGQNGKGGTDQGTEKKTVSAIEQDVKTAEGESDMALGRYMESEIPLPENVTYVTDAKELEDGTLRLLGSTAEGSGVWDHNADTEQWEEAYPASEEIENVYRNGWNGVIEADGSTFFVLSDENLENHTYAKITADGKVKQVPVILPDSESNAEGMEDYIYYMQDAEEGKILCKSVFDDHIYLMDDESGEMIRTFNEEEKYIGFWRKMGSEIFLFESEEMRCVDYETGEELPVDPALKEQIESDKTNLEVLSTTGYPLVMCQGETENVIYYANNTGIYRYTKGGTLVEQIADGSLNSLGKPSVMLCSIQLLSDGALLIRVMDDGKFRLLQYRYDAGAPSVPDEELKVYSLKENVEISQAISMFQTANPQYYVNLEVGMTGEDAVTASDALRTLNTEIMAGNGPDILVLDDMPMDSYIEKGILTDITDLVTDVKAEADFYENILNVYEKEEGLYAVPTRFQIPILQAAPEVLEKADSLKALADTAKELREKDREATEIVSGPTVYWMLKKFYDAYSPKLILEDGSISRENVTEFVSCMDEIFSLNQYSEEEREVRMATAAEENFDASTLVDSYEFLTNEVKIGSSNLSSGFSLAQMVAVNELKELDYKLTGIGDANVFVPKSTVGISSRSTQTEGAKAFVEFLLSEKVQSTNQGGGLPVNKSALDNEISNVAEVSSSFGWTTMNDEGEMEDIILEVGLPSEESRNRFKKLTETLDTPALTDAVTEERILEQAGRCLTGEITIEEAVSAIEQKMNLYLAE